VAEKSASASDLLDVFELLPELYKKGIGDGELESLAVLHRNRELTFYPIDTCRCYNLYRIIAQLIGVGRLLKFTSYVLQED
jgi:hypothetical protein